MLREVMRDEMAFESAPLSGTDDQRHHRVGCPRSAESSDLLTQRSLSLPPDKILRNLLGRFPAWNLNPIPLAIFVIDKDMRTRTLNS